jgi:PTH1 family peptidyl-tRNA hydrolase
MNNSGEAIAYLSSRFGIKPQELLVIYDEMALPVGKLRLRASGSDAGHNGIKSIISTIGTLEFPRVRVGIGRPENHLGQIPHVIGRFSKEEAPFMEQAVSTVVDMLETIIQEGIVESMNRFN